MTPLEWSDALSLDLPLRRKGAAQAAAGDLASVRAMASELALWFRRHAQSMDAALALHLRREGHNPGHRRGQQP